MTTQVQLLGSWHPCD